MNRFLFGGLAVLVSFSTATALGAAAKPRATAAAVQTVLDCRALSDDVQRLVCFDKSVGAMAQAQSSGDLLAMDKEQRQAVRRQTFGLTLPSLSLFDRGEKPEEADNITVKVLGAKLNPLGKWIIRLDDGAVWRQTDDNQLINDPHSGSKAVIHRGMIGSFLMNVDGQQAIKVHRDS